MQKRVCLILFCSIMTALVMQSTAQAGRPWLGRHNTRQNQRYTEPVWNWNNSSQNTQQTLPRGRAYIRNRYFGSPSNRFYGPQYGYF